MIRTETQLQDLIHSIYEGDTSTPSSTTEDYSLRRNYLNMGIGFWEGWRGTRWAELYALLSGASDGDKTAATNDIQWDCPTDLVDTLGFVQILDASNNALVTYTQISPAEAQVYKNSARKGNVYWLTGGPNSKKINLYPKIASDYNGLTIYYPYYKKATLFTGTTDVAEPSDHTFLIHYALYWLYREEDPGSAREQLDIAISMLQKMKQDNDRDETYQDLSIYDKTSSGFGA